MDDEMGQRAKGDRLNELLEQAKKPQQVSPAHGTALQNSADILGPAVPSSILLAQCR
jgi:hypothetical protein